MENWAQIYIAIADDISSAATNSTMTAIFGGVIIVMSIIVGTLNSYAMRQQGRSILIAILPMVALFATGIGFASYGFTLSNSPPIAIKATFLGCKEKERKNMYMQIQATNTIQFYFNGSTAPNSMIGRHTLRTTKALCDTLPLNVTKTFLCAIGGDCVGWLVNGKVERGSKKGKKSR